MRRGLLIAWAALSLCSCSRDGGAPTAEQNRGLDEAADLLNQAPDSLANVDDSAVSDGNSAAVENQ